jgi:protein tyrosine phosphatase
MHFLPFDRAYWACSSLLAGCYPGSPSQEESRLKAIKLIQCGVSHCINLMEPDECDHHGNAFVSYRPALTSAANQQGRSITFSRHAIPDCSIPTVEGMIAILDEIDSIISAHRTVYVHCWGGRGRTGTVVGCYLIRHRLTTPEVASRKLADLTAHNASVFRKIPETMVQEEFLRRWEPGA